MKIKITFHNVFQGLFLSVQIGLMIYLSVISLSHFSYFSDYYIVHSILYITLILFTLASLAKTSIISPGKVTPELIE
jgi:hypothetical protein